MDMLLSLVNLLLLDHCLLSRCTALSSMPATLTTLLARCARHMTKILLDPEWYTLQAVDITLPAIS